MKRNFLTLFLFSSVLACSAQLPYQNPNLSADERAMDLLGRMTLEEKLDQMKNGVPANERLGIPPTDWWNEALHGVARAGKATVFPQAIGLAATFDPEDVRETFTMISDEARAKHHDFKRKGEYKRYQGLTFWTPTINIFRDPRWGRGQESYGEDPYLTAVMGVAVVNGLQGGSDRYDKTHACAKHFAVHSGPEWNRHSFDAKNISGRDLWETYLPAFRALVEQADVKQVMCAYNRFEGEPCCSSDELLIRILREEWGYDEVIVSDCGGIDDLWQASKHGTYAGPAEASAAAVLTGTDLNCGNTYQFLGEAIRRGLLSEQEIDRSVFRLLRSRIRLGHLDPDEEVSWSQIPYSVVECKEHVDKALEMARKSMVLLENKNQVLPLDRNQKIAVIGPNAADSVMMWANYNGFPTKTVTILEGIQSKIPDARLIYEQGCDHTENRVFISLIDQCSIDGEPGFRATYWNNTEMSGEPVARDRIAERFNFSAEGDIVYAPGVSLKNFSARYESVFTPEFTGEVLFRIDAADGYRILLDGEEFAADWTNRRKAMNEYPYHAVKGKPVQVVLEYYQDYRTPYLKFDIATARELDYDAVAAKAKDADVIVFVGGISAMLEGESMPVSAPGFKGGDRTEIELPEVQSKMLKALKATGKPVVFVLCSGSAMALPWESENLDAILAAWYPGQQGGNAVADVLFGDYNPAGRLPVTFYASTDDLPDFEDYDMKREQGRTYRYFKGRPVYAFGHGLSYTSFDYGKGKISKNGNAARFEVDITNSGRRDGDEVVQLYIRDMQDPEGPIKSLRAIQRVHIPAGETRTVSLDLADDSFEFFDPQTGRPRIKPGKYEILYGGTSDDAGLQKLLYTFQ